MRSAREQVHRKKRLEQTLNNSDRWGKFKSSRTENCQEEDENKSDVIKAEKERASRSGGVIGRVTCCREVKNIRREKSPLHPLYLQYSHPPPLHPSVTIQITYLLILPPLALSLSPSPPSRKP